MTQLTRDDCIALLKNKYEEIRSQGRSDFPKRSDFSENEVIAVKSFFGPWPRAREAAGIKPVNKERIEKKKQKKFTRRRKDQKRNNP